MNDVCRLLHPRGRCYGVELLTLLVGRVHMRHECCVGLSLDWRLYECSDLLGSWVNRGHSVLQSVREHQ